jgi:peptide-methionine (R)-S-oxide reductase
LLVKLKEKESIMRISKNKSDIGWNRRSVLKGMGLAVLLGGVAGRAVGLGGGRLSQAVPQGGSLGTGMKEGNIPGKVIRSEEDWRRILTPEQFQVLRKKGTEGPFTGQYDHFKGEGTYECAGCDNELFSSETKFDSGTGWPSFWAPISEHAVRTQPDSSLFMKRTEVLCARCDGHLGHVFDDGPPPTRLRYCMNSVALKFVEKKDG